MSRTSELKLVRLDSLQPHPVNLDIYKDSERTTEEDSELRESIRSHGLWEGRVSIHPSGVILHGHRRVTMAIELGIEEATVQQWSHLPDDIHDPHVVQFLLNDNTSRTKTNVERIREFEVRKEVEAALARERKAAGAAVRDARKTDNGPSGPRAGRYPNGDARDLAARDVGLGSGRRAEQALQALKTADRIEEENPEGAQTIRHAINTSISTAPKVAQQVTAKPAPKLVEPPTMEQPAPGMKLVNSSHRIQKQSNVIDGVRHRSKALARGMPEFIGEMEYLKREMEKLNKSLQAAEGKLRSVGDHYRDLYVQDRYFADWMTVWANAWKEDGSYDYPDQLDHIRRQLSLLQGAFTGLLRLTQTDEVRIDP